MPIAWSQSLLVGYEPIDREHEELVSLINQFHDAVQQGRPRDEIDELLFTLADHVAGHFVHENQLMAASGYPDRGSHLQEHRQLIDRLDAVLDHFDLMPDAAFLEAIGFVDRWFTDHVVGADAKLGHYLCRWSGVAALPADGPA